MYALSNNPKTNIRRFYGLAVRKIEEGGEVKQRITEEQYNELDFEAKGLLFRSFFPKLVDKQDDSGSKWMVYDINNEYITIGRMIEFLNEYLENESDTDFCIRNKDGWSVGHYHHDNGPEGYDFTSSLVYNEEGNHIEELCDALWEACKEVLNKK